MTLRILWMSDRIIGGFSAYSKVSLECCRRLAEMGHVVAHIPMGRANRMGSWVWKGILILPSGNDPWGEDVVVNHYVDFKADMLITLKDVWVFKHLHKLALNWVPYVPVSHSPVSPSITSRLHTAFSVLTPSRFGQRELKHGGVEVPIYYVPHGVDTKVFRPLEGHKADCKRMWFLDEDDFTVGVVAMNRARKMIDRMLRAYKLFRDWNPDVKSHMLLWTDVRAPRREYIEGAVMMGVADVGVNLLPLIMELGLGEDILWPDSKLVREGIPDWAGEDYKGGWDMVKLYNAMDVLLGTTGGEGFFVPAIEAQSCGVPVVVTDYASAPEVCGAGLTVPVSDWVVINTPGVKFALADIEKTAEALTKIMNSDREKLARKARRFAMRFDWDRVFDMYWRPFLEEAELELKPLVTKRGVKAWT